MFEELKEMICEYVEVEPGEIREDSRFVEDLGFNSYDFMSMVGEIEEHWDVEVDEREVVNVKTVKDAMEYIQSRSGTQFDPQVVAALSRLVNESRLPYSL